MPNLSLQATELVFRQELDILFDNDGQFTLEEAQRLLDQNENVQVDTFIAVYYDKISPHLATNTKKEDANNQESKVQETSEQQEQEQEHNEENQDSQNEEDDVKNLDYITS